VTRAAPRHTGTARIAPTHVPPQSKPTYGQGRGGRPWRKKRDAVMKRDCYLCQPCKAAGRLTLATQCDHKVPMAEGGTDEDTNLQAICDACHEAKTKAEAARGVGRKFRG
jgi:5-methylcytosine-specific restriction protein A